MKGRLLHLSGGIIGLATASEVFGKWVNAVEKLRHFMIDTLGLSRLLNIHQALVVIVGLLLLSGYAVAAWWLYLKIRTKPARVRAAYMVVAVAGIATMAWINYAIIPPSPDPEAYLRQERIEWTERMLGSQGSDGGIRVTSLDVTARPQVWTSAQVLAAVLMGDGKLSDGDAARVRRTFDYIEQARLSNETGGWGYFEDWPWNITEITSWVTIAESLSLRKNVWRTDDERRLMIGRLARDLRTVGRSLQESDKGWSPVIVSTPRLSRTYSTVIATWAFVEARSLDVWSDEERSGYDMLALDGAQWLLTTFRSEVRSPASPVPIGWVPNPFRPNQRESFLGLNAQVLYVLAKAIQIPGLKDLRLHPNYGRAVEMFLADADFGSRNVSQNDRLHDSDRYLPAGTGAPGPGAAKAATCSCPLTIEGSTFLWYPWSVAAARSLAADASLPAEQQQKSALVATQLVERLSDSSSFVSGEMNYVNAEFLIGVTPRHAEQAPLRASLQ